LKFIRLAHVSKEHLVVIVAIIVVKKCEIQHLIINISFFASEQNQYLLKTIWAHVTEKL
jgi:hypothetical protein